jgi:hypothetical protein
MVGTHRRIYMQDVLANKAERDAARRKILDEWKDRNLPFADKLRALVSSCGFSPAIPNHLCELDAYAKTAAPSKTGSRPDGPDALTQIRNGLVHPSPTKRQRLAQYPGAIMQAWTLTRWYLDLVLLHVCGYQDVYSNRVSKDARWRGDEVESVPWAAGR